MPAVTIEQYRRLAATLHHAQTDSGIKVVMVASALAGEGKTLTAVNLALTLSELTNGVLLLINVISGGRRCTTCFTFQTALASTKGCRPKPSED